MSVKTVGVVGTGVIGASWTGLFLAHGLRVIVADPGPGAEEKLQAYLEGIWPSLEQMGLVGDASLSNYKFVGASLGEYAQKVDFIQESAPERPDIKEKLLGELDAAVRPDIVIASSSSGIPSSKFISKCQHSERVLVGHPFNPPHLMPLVEVVPHPKTSSEAISAAMAFYETLGRRPVHIKEETPGFVANRLQAALCGEAYALVARGVISAEDLDACITTSLGPRYAMVGPILANTMGGGGGAEGFTHMLQHIGPASRVWTEDMKKHEFDWSEKSIAAVSASVADELKGKDMKELERKRDEDLVRFFKIKGKRRTSFHALQT